MTTTHTALIVPAISDLAGQCRIVARFGTIRNALKDYAKNPEPWQEVGLMNSRGELVCCTPCGDLVDQLQACVPLMASLTIRFTAPGHVL